MFYSDVVNVLINVYSVVGVLYKKVKLLGVVNDVPKMVTECFRARAQKLQLHDKTRKTFSKI